MLIVTPVILQVDTDGITIFCNFQLSWVNLVKISWILPIELENLEAL